MTEIELGEYPELITLEARENKIGNILPLNAPKLKNLYLVFYIYFCAHSTINLTITQSFNKLTTINGLDRLESCERLYLRGNELTSTEGISSSLKNLVHLNLRSNLIDSFDEIKRLSALPKLISLTLIGINFRLLFLCINFTEQITLCVTRLIIAFTCWVDCRGCSD
jgi:Leucine-rich repeat (LRR) protein